MWKREAEESVSEWCDSRKTVNSLILGFCIHVPLGLEGFSPISCSVSQEENRMVLMLWHPSASRKPGCTLSQHSLYCAFFISGDPGDGVPAHVEDLWDFRGPRCYVCTCKCVSEVFREIDLFHLFKLFQPHWLSNAAFSTFLSSSFIMLSIVIYIKR